MTSAPKDCARPWRPNSVGSANPRSKKSTRCARPSRSAPPKAGKNWPRACKASATPSIRAWPSSPKPTSRRWRPCARSWTVGWSNCARTTRPSSNRCARPWTNISTAPWKNAWARVSSSSASAWSRCTRGWAKCRPWPRAWATSSGCSPMSKPEAPGAKCSSNGCWIRFSARASTSKTSAPGRTAANRWNSRCAWPVATTTARKCFCPSTPNARWRITNACSPPWTRAT